MVAIKRLRRLKQWMKQPFVKSKKSTLPCSENDEKLMAARDVHKGERGFIIGNGPSLQVGDLDRLKGEVTFASNRIYLAFEETAWRPTYLTVTDSLVAQRDSVAINALPLKKYFGHATFPYLARGDNVVFCNPPQSHFDRFDWNLVDGVSTGHSVLYWDLQLAFWMGIREVIAIGVDFHFDVLGKPTGKMAMGNDVIESFGEKNHFHPNYRPAGEAWTMPKLDRQREEFELARRKFSSVGGTIVNASRVTALDVWPRMEFDELIG